MGKSKKNMIDTDDEVHIRRQCKYIGSFAINMNKTEERQTLMNERLEELKRVKKGICVVLQIATEGIKVYDENEQVVKMAHSIMRIAFSTCSPDTRLFAYVARSASSLKSPSILQSHVFKTKKGSHAQQLAALVSKAFRIHFAMATLQRTSKIEKFENDVDKSKEGTSPLQHRRNWAKKEIARGHDFSEHAARARKTHPLAMLPGKSDPIDSEMLSASRKISTTEFDNQRLTKQVEPLDHTISDYEEIPAQKNEYEDDDDGNDGERDSLSFTSAQVHGLKIDEDDSRTLLADQAENETTAEGEMLSPKTMERSESSLAVAKIDEIVNAYSNCDYDQNEDHYSEIPNEQTVDVFEHAQSAQTTSHAQVSNDEIDVKYEQMTVADDQMEGELYVDKDHVRFEIEESAEDEALYVNVNPNRNEDPIETSVEEATEENALEQATANEEVQAPSDELEVSVTNNGTPGAESELSHQEDDDTLETPYTLNTITRMDYCTKERSETITDEDLMKDSYWYQAGLSRKISEELLKNEEVGSFFIRDSTSIPGAYAMCIKVPKSVKDSQIGNILIEKLAEGGYRIQGFGRSFPSIPMLVAYYASFRDELPVKLRLDNNNPLFDKDDGDEVDGVETVIDPDYQRFDSSEPIMHELACE